MDHSTNLQKYIQFLNDEDYMVDNKIRVVRGILNCSTARGGTLACCRPGVITTLTTLKHENHNKKRKRLFHSRFGCLSTTMVPGCALIG